MPTEKVVVSSAFRAAAVENHRGIPRPKSFGVNTEEQGFLTPQ